MRKNIAGKAFGISITIVACLTFLFGATYSIVFIYPLFPGMVLSLLITGGHGGTIAEDRIALVFGFAINTLTYSLLCAALLVILRKRKEG
jgi:hypothetical protein